MKKIALLIVVFALQFLGLSAQDFGFEASVNRNPVQVGERFRISFELKNTEGEITPPPITELQIVFGPSKSSNFSYVNGQSSRSTTLSYTVVAGKAGTYTIDAAEAKTEHGVLRTQPLKIVVEEAPAAASNAGTTATTQPKTNEKKINKTGDIILQAEISKKQAFLGEPIVVNYYLYSRYQSLELGESQYPSWNGFWVSSDKPDKISWDPELTTINGMRYRSVLLDRQIIYPQKVGKLKIDPMELRVHVNRSFFNAGTPFDLESNRIEITVKPLPKGAPASFNGVVGNYKMTFQLDAKDTLKVNEAIQLKLRVTGSGNMAVLPKPNIQFPKDFEVYDPKVVKRFKTQNGKTSGSVDYEYLLIPRFPGKYKIPEITFTHFNWANAKYKTQKLNIPELHIVGENGGQAFVGSSGLIDRQQVELLSEDIRYIHSENLVRKQPLLKAVSLSYWFIGLLPWLALIFGWAWRRRAKKYASNTELVARDKANKGVRKYLANAKKSLEKEPDLFYQNLQEGFETALMAFFKFDRGEITATKIQEKLSDAGVDQNTIDDLNAIFEECSMARFAPSSPGAKQQTFEKSKSLMNVLFQIKKS